MIAFPYYVNSQSIHDCSLKSEYQQSDFPIKVLVSFTVIIVHISKKKSQVMPECLKMSESSIIRLVICMYFIRVILLFFSFLIFILLFLFCHSWLYVCLLVICKLYYVRCSHIYKSTQGKRHLIYLSQNSNKALETFVCVTFVSVNKSWKLYA